MSDIRFGICQEMVAQSHVDDVILAQGFKEGPPLAIVPVDLVENVAVQQRLKISVHRIDRYLSSVCDDGVTDFLC